MIFTVLLSPTFLSLNAPVELATVKTSLPTIPVKLAFVVVNTAVVFLS